MHAYLSKSPSDSTTNTLWKSCVEEVLASSEAVLHVPPTALGRFSLGIGCFLVSILRSLLILHCFVSLWYQLYTVTNLMRPEETLPHSELARTDSFDEVRGIYIFK